LTLDNRALKDVLSKNC